MRSIIEDLFHGDIQSADSVIITDVDYRNALAAIVEIEQLLKDTLDERESGLLDKLIEKEAKIQSIISRESFVDGFKKGAKIVVSVYE